MRSSAKASSGPSSDASAALAALLPEGCRAVVLEFASASVSVGIEDLWPEERPVVASAIERRRQEFIIGRSAARQAMAKLGSAPAAIPVGPSRQPQWPAGHVGSISHTRELVAAAAGRTEHARSLGIDVEIVGSVTDELADRILTKGERAALDAGPIQDGATVIFSAKEALYKAQYPIHGRWLGFLDVDVELEVGHDGGPGRFTAFVGPDVDHELAGHRLDGKWDRVLGHAFTALAF